MFKADVKIVKELLGTTIVSVQKMSGYPVRAIEYKVNRNRAYQFEAI